MPRQTKLTDQGQYTLVNQLLQSVGNTWSFHLFKNAVVVTDATVLTDFVEADYSGYNPVVLGSLAAGNVADFFAGISGNKCSTGVISPSFPGNSGADQTVYGVYATANRGLGDELMYASNCFDPNPEAALAGKLVSGPSDTTVIAVRFYGWDYFQDRSQDGRYFMWQAAPPEYAIAGNPYTLSFYQMELFNLWNTAYAGTVLFTSSDPSDTWDPNPTAVAPPNGQMFLTLGTAGFRIILATDVTDDTLMGQIGIIALP